MFNGAHVLETALLMLAAFLVGAILGTLARLGLRRPLAQPVAAVLRQSEAPAAIAAEAPALVTAPVIDPLIKPTPPVAPADVPAPDFSAAILASAPSPAATRSAMKGMSPARVAGLTTSGRLVPTPQQDEPVRASVPAGPGADVIAFPGGRAAEPEAVVPVEESAAEPAPAPAEAVEAIAEKPAEAEATPTVDAAPAEPEPAPVVKAEAAEVAPAEAAPSVAPVPPSEALAPEAEHEETAAMRAIEGSWSPRRRRGAAPAQAGEDKAAVPEPPQPERPGRPVGLDAPRAGGPDSLTNIIGVLPILETALNRIGVYHFDQVAALSDENVGWVEGHLGIEGRIGREHWREQARELALVTQKAAAAPSGKAADFSSSKARPGH
jgi:predicted flap endonuclease-1-like 5' DNA nuclease